MTLIRRGQVYFADFGPVLTLPEGETSIEIALRRPVVVVSLDALNRVSDRRPFYVLVVPGTTGVKTFRDFPTNVRLSEADTGLPQATVFLAHQTRSIDSRRLDSNPVGRLNDTALTRLEAALRYSLGLGT